MCVLCRDKKDKICQISCVIQTRPTSHAIYITTQLHRKPSLTIHYSFSLTRGAKLLLLSPNSKFRVVVNNITYPRFRAIYKIAAKTLKTRSLCWNTHITRILYNRYLRVECNLNVPCRPVGSTILKVLQVLQK